MRRWLAIFADNDGTPRSALISVPEEREADFPFGSGEHFVDQLDGYNDGGGLVLVEMPDATFRPMVVDVQNDEEVAAQFIDI